jgi:kanamycin kinase
VDLDSLADRFGASSAEPIHLGLSDATVVRMERSSEAFFYKAGQGVDDDADRLEWLIGTGIPCPRVLDRGDSWMLMSELAGRDAAQPWPERDRPRVLEAIAEGLLGLHALDVESCPFASPFPGKADAVTHGDYAAPNVFIDSSTLRFSGVLDISRLGSGDRYVDVALMYKSLSGDLNPQYGGPPAARRFVEAYGADPEDRRIAHYIALDNSGAY